MAEERAVLEQVPRRAGGARLDDAGQGRVLPDDAPVLVLPEGRHVVAGYVCGILDCAALDDVVGHDGWVRSEICDKDFGAAQNEPGWNLWPLGFIVFLKLVLGLSAIGEN